MDFLSSARTVINTCLGLRKGEKVLIIIDKGREKIGDALFQATLNAKGEPLLVKIQTKKPGEEPPEPLTELMKAVDAIVIITEFSLTHTRARRLATKYGARVIAMPGITESLFTAGISADLKEIETTIKKLYWALRKCEKINVETKLGTKLALSVKDREWIAEDTGMCRERGSIANLPAGKIFIATNESETSGILVVNGSLGGIKLARPAKITIREGFAEEIDDEKIEKILAEKGKLSKTVGKFGIGVNPKAKIVGNPLEDEKVLGTCHVGFGDNFAFGGKIKCGAYLGAVITQPTVEVDSRTIIKDGKLLV